MLDFLIVILLIFIVLLMIQIVALLRMHRFIRYFKNMLLYVGSQMGYYKTSSKAPIQTCQFCKYRQTYIKATVSGRDEDFYYRCKLHHKPVSLSGTCKQFEYDPDA